MTDELETLLESMDPTDPATWAVLADWFLERGLTPAPTPLPTIDGLGVTSCWRLGFVTSATLEFHPSARPGLYDLQPLLRSRPWRLTTELQVGSLAEREGRGFGRQQGLTARQLEAVLASAPTALHALTVWQSTDPSDVAILEPLTRQRPLSARTLVLRANAQVLLQQLARIAPRRWQTITLRSAWRPHDLEELDGLVTRFPDVAFELVGVGPRRTPNLHWVPEREGLKVTCDGQWWNVAPDAPAPEGLRIALWELGLVLRRTLGTFELARDPNLGALAAVELDGVALVAPRAIEPGLSVNVRLEDPGRQAENHPGGTRDQLVFFIPGLAPRHRSGQLSFTRPPVG